MKESNKPIALRVLVCAVIAALYALPTRALAPISYGALQFRAAEALCVLPLFMPFTSWGLFAGCLLANLMTGNPWDVALGSLATLLAARCTAACGRRGLGAGNTALGCLMPVLFAAPVVGAVLTASEGRIFTHLGLLASNTLRVGAGELAVMFIIGYPLARLLPGVRAFRELAAKTQPKEKGRKK